MDISSMLEVQVKEELDVKENVTPGQDQASSASSSASIPVSQEENNYYKLMFGNDIASVRFRRLHCTACDIHIGSAPSQAHNMFEHPVLRTLLCANCREFYGDGTFEQGDDDTDMFCRWCANGGNLYCCSYCSNTFCYKCIRRNFAAQVRKKIEADEKWKCFVCNPSDLYNARAVCWALLQHIQTVRRILAHDKKMSSMEIEEKMNADESLCCPHKNKRRGGRRRFDSNSEEEDETYLPEDNDLSIGRMKRKQLKKRKSISRPIPNIPQPIYRPPVPIRPRPASFLSGQSFQAESPNSTVVSHKKSIPSEGIVLSSSGVMKSNTSIPSRFDSNALQQQQQQQQSSVYHTSFMNTSGSTAYIQPTRIILPPQSQPQPQSQLTPYQSQQTSSYQSQSLQTTPNTMVSIPNLIDHSSKPLFILPKPKEVNMTLTPNVIELDSDSDDEPKVVAEQDKSTTNKDSNANVANKVVPVALTWENSDDDLREEQPLVEVRSISEKNASFGETMLPYSQELDKFLSDVKTKMYNFFNVTAVENVEVEARQRIKNFYYNMRDTIYQLVCINDRVIRQYNEWRRSQKMETPPLKDKTTSREKVNIPLDMICINDSDTESEKEVEENQQLVEPSDLIKDSNIIKYLLLCKKNVVHCGVGDDSPHLSVDKAIQVYDVVSRDYEKCIGYSVITKTDEKTNNSVLDDTPSTPDKNFGKYEEQFIYYLQHIEDNSIETEDSKSLGELDETLLQEVAQTNSSFISDSSFITDFFKDIGFQKYFSSSVEPTDQSENSQQEKDDMSDSINPVIKDNENDILCTSDKEIANNAGVKLQETNMQPDGKLQQTESQKTHVDATNGESVILHNNEINSKENNTINMEIVASTGNEEDCTIIDD
ncbi:uncharacterized protein LOC105830802 [Monomorium pharaonis]|uniref:uncharacterized protein LOC105830802 n=1 Tax=Monomorium pharaonis TaxID=307658 RepID=UPI00063F8444|nr:uncharacterized protein LOC105830802 [Monomorium pharaonis]XP_012525850.1 uncharacterized protein LOC105830802 [Monomorium pharaonis]